MVQQAVVWSCAATAVPVFPETLSSSRSWYTGGLTCHAEIRIYHLSIEFDDITSILIYIHLGFPTIFSLALSLSCAG